MRAGVTPDVVDYVPQIHTMLALVDSGVGVALTPETATRLRFEGVVLRRLDTTPARPVEMAFAYRKDNANPMIRVFRREVQEALKEYQAPARQSLARRAALR
jgi:DNA-binding transcriptional LysR family regulator